WKTMNRGESAIRLRQMLFDGFATSNEVGRQQATANSRAYSLLNTSERTALTVAQVYIDVLTQREMVRLAQENLKSHERTGHPQQRTASVERRTGPGLERLQQRFPASADRSAVR
nr:hypothetical protein [Tanacetum cinerariifolium]